ncbi:zinc finger SWIM domain-containing protein 3 [Pogona vitticeps]
MELGSCFKNYEDFREFFSTYKKENRLRYRLKSCISVRFYNRKNGTNIREDVTFMQAKFGCGRLRDYCKKKQLSNLCPAYLVLEYNKELDRLVICEVNNNHVHVESKSSSVSSNPQPLARMAVKMAGSKDGGTPPFKLRKEEPAEVESCEMNSINVKIEVDTNENMETEMESFFLPPSPHKEPDVPQAEEDNSSNNNSALVQVAELMKNILLVDTGSLGSTSVGSNQDLERLNFQTSKMKSLFIRFPESLLLHQVPSERGHVLYAFLVESKDRVGKLVHFAILKEDTQENVQKMLSVFKEFNPEWQKVKVVFVDLSFRHQPVLQELFPSAQVLLSVYHTVQLLEKKLKESRSSFSFRQNLKLALRKAVFSTSTRNLETLSQLVKRLVDQELYEHLQTNWFSCEMLWYMHAKKGLHYCSTYIDSLDLITQKVSSLFNSQSSLEASILRFVEYADCFNTKGLGNLNQDFSGLEQDSHRGLMEEPRTKTRASAKCSSTSPSQKTPTRTAADLPKPFLKHSPAKPVATMLTALQETCTDLAYQLCLNEWDVVQKSAQLFTSTKNKISVQLLEDTYQVQDSGKSCTCYFHRRYQLPCRHILSMLLANRRVVEENMVGKRWQKKYQHLPVLQENLLGQPCHSTGIQGAMGVTEERWDKVQSLSKELGNLLLQSEGEELEERLSTLRMIVNIWAQCCELQEEEEEGAENPRKVRNVGDLPFLWVKKEEVEDIELASGTPDLPQEENQKLATLKSPRAL